MDHSVEVLDKGTEARPHDPGLAGELVCPNGRTELHLQSSHARPPGSPVANVIPALAKCNLFALAEREADRAVCSVLILAFPSLEFTMDDSVTASRAARPSPEARAAAAAGQGRYAYSVMEQRELQAIDASPAQRAQIRVILTRARDDVRAKRGTSADLRKQLAQVLTAPSLDAWDADGVRQEILAHQESIDFRLLQARQEIADLLTPVQRGKLLALAVQRHAQWQYRHTSEPGAFASDSRRQAHRFHR